MNARHLLLAARCALLAGAVTLAACNRESAGPPAPDTTASAAARPSSSASSATGTASSASSPAAAAPPLVPASFPTAAVAPNADTTAGKQIASQGASGAAACSGCHGVNGEGNAASGFPRLAGLGSTYIVHQLDSYADGTRAHPVMTPIASALTPQQREEVATYYAALGADAASGSAQAQPAASGAARTAGGSGAAPVIAVRGDESKGVQACINCHGPQGIGDAGPNPYLAGQHAQYLANAMAAWKSGQRHNDPSGQMPAIAKALDDNQTQALVAYFSSLPPPAPRNSQAAAAMPSASRPAVQSGPVTATAPVQGTGVNQGAGTTGGAQGNGAGGAATNPAQGPNR